MESPCVKPILRLPWVTTLDNAVGIGKPAPPPPAAGAASAAVVPEGGWVVVRGMSKSPFTSCRSGARLRRKV